MGQGGVAGQEVGEFNTYSKISLQEFSRLHGHINARLEQILFLPFLFFLFIFFRHYFVSLKTKVVPKFHFLHKFYCCALVNCNEKIFYHTVLLK